MLIKYKYYSDRGLLVDRVEGKVGARDIKELFLHLTGTGGLPDFSLVLSDINKSTLDISIYEIPGFARLIINNTNRPGFKWAIRSTGPRNTALSMAVQLIPGLEEHVKVCSTLEGCVEYLGVHYDEKEFDDSDFTVFREKEH